MGYRDYSVAKGHIVDAAGHGDFTTITGAIAAASAGQTIFIRPGVYTENPTLKAGVNLAAFVCDAFTPNVTILGKCSYSGSGAVSLSGIRLKTNADYVLEITGANASTVTLHECYLEVFDNDGISFASSNAASALNIFQCTGDITGAPNTYLVQTSPGITELQFCYFENLALSNNPINIQAGTFNIRNAEIRIGIALSNFVSFGCFHSNIDPQTLGLNMTSVASSGSGGGLILNSYFASGTSSAFVIGAGTGFTIANCAINCSNTFVLTGGGSLAYGLIAFTSASSGNNVSTQIPLTTI